MVHERPGDDPNSPGETLPGRVVPAPEQTISSAAATAECPACGQPLPPDTRFCQACGAPASAEPTQDGPVRGRQPWLAAVAVLWLVAMVAGLWFLYTYAFSIGST
jgi:predicted amidophosphoribosyltransferase